MWFSRFVLTGLQQFLRYKQVPLHLAKHNQNIHIGARRCGRCSLTTLTTFAPFSALIQMLTGLVVVLSDRRRRSQVGSHHPRCRTETKKQLNACTSSAHLKVKALIHHPEAGWMSADHWGLQRVTKGTGSAQASLRAAITSK